MNQPAPSPEGARYIDITHTTRTLPSLLSHAKSHAPLLEFFGPRSPYLLPLVICPARPSISPRHIAQPTFPLCRLPRFPTTPLSPSVWLPGKSFLGMLKNAASGVLALLPCSRTECTLRAPKRLRPCWTCLRRSGFAQAGELF